MKTLSIWPDAFWFLNTPSALFRDIATSQGKTADDVVSIPSGITEMHLTAALVAAAEHAPAW
jgi:hypothetical protein